jgi:cation diffusion facilitator CzcD-associated flavoprotein CzcO
MKRADFEWWVVVIMWIQHTLQLRIENAIIVGKGDTWVTIVPTLEEMVAGEDLVEDEEVLVVAMEEVAEVVVEVVVEAVVAPGPT